MPHIYEYATPKSYSRSPGFEPTLGYIQEVEDDAAVVPRMIFRDSEQSPLIKITKGDEVLSSEQGVKLSDAQRRLLTENKYLGMV